VELDLRTKVGNRNPGCGLLRRLLDCYIAHHGPAEQIAFLDLTDVRVWTSRATLGSNVVGHIIVWFMASLDAGRTSRRRNRRPIFVAVAGCLGLDPRRGCWHGLATDSHSHPCCGRFDRFADSRRCRDFDSQGHGSRQGWTWLGLPGSFGWRGCWADAAVVLDSFGVSVGDTCWFLLLLPKGTDEQALRSRVGTFVIGRPGMGSFVTAFGKIVIIEEFWHTDIELPPRQSVIPWQDLHLVPSQRPSHIARSCRY
jgi:hypothetical protein